VAGEGGISNLQVEEAPLAPDVDSAEQGVPPSAAAGQIDDRMIIRTGSMGIVVADTEDTIARIGEIVERAEGWIVSSTVYQNSSVSNAFSGSINMRVPAERYDALVDQIRELALEVRTENFDSQDVSAEYVDLESQLANLEATAARVRAFLDEARTVEEALQVNSELSRLEGEIEVIKGRMQYLEQSSAYSSLTVELTPDELAQPIEIGGWRPEGVARDAIQTLIEALKWLAELLIWGVIFCLPIALIIGIPLYFIGRPLLRRIRRRSDRAAATSPAESASQDKPAET
jgi:hypothetical protein